MKNKNKEKTKKKSSRWTTALLVLVFLTGLSLVVYPSLADYINSLHQSRIITAYNDAVNEISEEDYTAVIEAARQYNERLSAGQNPHKFTAEEQAEYNALLNVLGNGIIGYIEIPSIEVSLPIYHTTEERVLQRAAGHLEWSSLPIGGADTHAVLSGHRGLPSAKLFSDLDDIVEGDIFMIRVLDEVLTYQVDQVLIVLPQEINELLIEPGCDYCTLVTCTPYGINTHRLLVRGRRISNAEEAAFITIPAELVQIDPLIIAGCIATPILILLIIFELIGANAGRRRRKRKLDWHKVKRD